MNSSTATRDCYTASILAAIVGATLMMGVPNDSFAQRRTTEVVRQSAKTLNGQMLPLEPLPPGMEPAIGELSARRRMAVCKPAQTTGGPGPAQFSSVADWPSGLEFMWPAVQGAVAYLVERAVDNTTTWILVGSTCGSPDAIREYAHYSGQTVLLFRDIAGGYKAGETYVYKVTAVGAAGEVGWNSFRWTPLPYLPSVTKTTITGSTVELTVSQNCWRFSKELAVTASYGLNRLVVFSTNGVCVAPTFTTVTSPVVVYGVPDGTHTFTVSALWTQTLDPNMPRVVGTTSTSTSITIKP